MFPNAALRGAGRPGVEACPCRPPAASVVAIEGVESDPAPLSAVGGQVPDGQPDLCEVLFLDGFESGDTTAWTQSTP